MVDHECLEILVSHDALYNKWDGEMEHGNLPAYPNQLSGSSCVRFWSFNTESTKRSHAGPLCANVLISNREGRSLVCVFTLDVGPVIANAVARSAARPMRPKIAVRIMIMFERSINCDTND